jgi:hypothetical protein
MGYKRANNRSDIFQTPDTALNPILQFIPKEYRIWEPASANGNLVKFFSGNGYNIVGTDINTGTDFFTNEVEFDCIITNPPYSIKDEWIERCYSFNKPFMLLLPITALEGIKRQKQYKEHGLELILFNRRINYETPSGQGSGAYFSSAWFTYGFNLPQQLNFIEIKK